MIAILDCLSTKKTKMAWVDTCRLHLLMSFTSPIAMKMKATEAADMQKIEKNFSRRENGRSIILREYIR
jgi:hypothetical protein